MAKVLYINCSSYSGSTLLSFVLNGHRDMFSIGHTTGWSFAPDQPFYCSCGEEIQDCPFYRHIAECFRRAGFAFEFSNFGLGYRLARNNRLNRCLTARLPLVAWPGLERLRDRLVARVPALAGRLRDIDRRNRCFIEAALAYLDASVFVDNSHSPYRLRFLRAAEGLDLARLHLVRDPRGVAFSNMALRRVGPARATTMWIRDQVDICRIAQAPIRGQAPGDLLRIHYEDLCDETDRTLGEIHRFVGLSHQPFSGDFKDKEHHILGNVMRLGASKIVKSTKWRDELSAEDLGQIEATAQRFARGHRDHPVTAIIEHYLGR